MSSLVALDAYDSKNPLPSDYAVKTFEYTDLPAEKAGTANDRRDMHRMGKTQQFRRNFSFIPIFGFAAVLMITWEGMLKYACPILDFQC